MPTNVAIEKTKTRYLNIDVVANRCVAKESVHLRRRKRIVSSTASVGAVLCPRNASRASGRENGNHTVEQVSGFRVFFLLPTRGFSRTYHIHKRERVLFRFPTVFVGRSKVDDHEDFDSSFAHPIARRSLEPD